MQFGNVQRLLLVQIRGQGCGVHQGCTVDVRGGEQIQWVVNYRTIEIVGGQVFGGCGGAGGDDTDRTGRYR